MKKVFLKAEWRKLLMINYEVDSTLIHPYIPAHTQLDLYEGKCLISIVGFVFLNTAIKNIRVPFHINFEEVNLRFYVTHQTGSGEIKRGTTFIREIVPRRAITFIANTLYNEKYITLPMSHQIEVDKNNVQVKYNWRFNGSDNYISCKAKRELTDIDTGSLEEFVTEHYWGYTHLTDNLTSEYGVEHPRWQCYPIEDYEVNIDFENLYSKAFAGLKHQKPHSVLLAEGSEILVREGIKF